MKNKIIKNISLISLGIIKSFFNAVTQIAWGITGIIALGIGLLYMFEKYEVEAFNSINPLFLKLQNVILDNLMVFVIAFFVIYLYSELKDLEEKE